MTFDELLNDIEKLEGKKLNSIRPGAEITVKQINKEQNRIILLTATGKERTRPISELKYIWEALCQHPAVHVDEALHGSGTSRNQPETILANLPYIEWFEFHRKKHVAYVNKNSHQIGSLKKMDEVNAEILREKITKEALSPYSAGLVIVTEDILSATQGFEKLTGVTVTPVRMGIYKSTINGILIYYVTGTSISQSILQGTYILLNKPAKIDTPILIDIAGRQFNVGYINGLQVIVPLDNTIEVDNLF